MMNGVAGDVRNAFRSLLVRPALSVILVLTLGLGIGAATTVYSFFYALLLRPYPYADAEALVRVRSVNTKEGGAKRGMSLLDVPCSAGCSLSMKIGPSLLGAPP